MLALLAGSPRHMGQSVRGASPEQAQVEADSSAMAKAADLVVMVIPVSCIRLWKRLWDRNVYYTPWPSDLHSRLDTWLRA